MSCSIIRRFTLATLLAGGMSAGFSPLGASAQGQTRSDLASSMGVSVISQPSQSVKLTFPSAGIIREKKVEDGDRVKAGQLLLKQDTDLDVKEGERLKVEAESVSRIEAAQADMKVKEIDYNRKSKSPNAYAASEIEEAQAKLIEAEKSVKVAEEDHLQAKIKWEQQMVRLAKMELTSPLDGIVQHVVLDVGEMADPQSRDGAIVVVKNDPLWVEIRGLTTMQVATLKEGEKLQVRYLNDPADEWKEGEICFITPVADAGADRQLVRLKLPNPQLRDAGLRMELRLPDKLQKAAPKEDGILSLK